MPRLSTTAAPDRLSPSPLGTLPPPATGRAISRAAIQVRSLAVSSRPWTARVLSLLAAFLLANASALGVAQDQPTAEKPTPKVEKQDKAGKKKEREGSKFLRIQRDEAKTPIGLETAIIRYTPGKAADGKSSTEAKTASDRYVDLIGVVHVGDKDYYQQLNERFKQYDAVLYELVAPEGTRVPKGGARDKSGHPVTALQRGMQSALELDFQLDQVDYTRPNFIHADMSPEEMAKSMTDKNESWMQLVFRMMAQSMAQQGRTSQKGASPDAQLLFALFAKDRALRLKRIAAEQFENMEDSMAVLEGPDGSTLITERNKKALQVLKRELDGGKKRIAIFYGAGHMPDIENRLLDEFGMQRGEQSWLTAWSMRPKQAAGKTSDGKASEAKPTETKPPESK